MILRTVIFVIIIFHIFRVKSRSIECQGLNCCQIRGYGWTGAKQGNCAEFKQGIVCVLCVCVRERKRSIKGAMQNSRKVRFWHLKCKLKVRLGIDRISKSLDIRTWVRPNIRILNMIYAGFTA